LRRRSARPPRVSGLYAGEATERLAAVDGVVQYRPIAAVRRYARAWGKERARETASADVPLTFAPGEAY
jgi:hypothetical protein